MLYCIIYLYKIGGDAPGPVTVTFTTLNGDYVAKAIFTYKKFENSTTEQTTRAKRFLDEVEESVKRLRSVTDYESDEFAEENNQELGKNFQLV